MRIHPRTAVAALAVGTALSVTAMPGVALADDTVRGKNRVLVVVVGFNDATFPDESLVMKNAAESYFGAERSPAHYYSKMSRGQFTYVPAAEGKVVGPYHLDLPQNPCEAGAVREQTQKKLEADGYVKGEDYDSISIIQPGEGAQCGWSGLGSVPGPNTWVSLGGDEISEALLVHELGHNQGYGHHMRDFCPDGDVSRCAEDGTSHKTPMGGGGSGVGFVAPELIHAGWLGGGQTRTVGASGTYDLVSLHGEKSGTRALDIPMGDDRLVVEYRHEVAGFPTDEGNLDAAVEGVHAYRVKDGDYANSVLLDPTEKSGSGREDAITTLTDRKIGLEVKVVKSGAGAATVAVSLNGKPAGAKPAAVPASPKAKSPSAKPRKTEGDPISEEGTDAGKTHAGNADHKASETPDATPAPDLAETGESSVSPYLAVGGIGLFGLGLVVVLGIRHRGRGRRGIA